MCNRRCRVFVFGVVFKKRVFVLAQLLFFSFNMVLLRKEGVIIELILRKFRLKDIMLLLSTKASCQAAMECLHALH